MLRVSALWSQQREAESLSMCLQFAISIQRRIDGLPDTLGPWATLWPLTWWPRDSLNGNMSCLSYSVFRASTLTVEGLSDRVPGTELRGRWDASGWITAAAQHDNHQSMWLLERCSFSGKHRNNEKQRKSTAWVKGWCWITTLSK